VNALHTHSAERVGARRNRRFQRSASSGTVRLVEIYCLNQRTRSLRGDNKQSAVQSDVHTELSGPDDKIRGERAGENDSTLRGAATAERHAPCIITARTPIRGGSVVCLGSSRSDVHIICMI